MKCQIFFNWQGLLWRRINSFLILTLCLVLGACASMLHPGPPPLRLNLSPAKPEKIIDKPLNKQLVVSTPLASEEISTDNIALVFRNREIRYLADARWVGPVPSLVRRNLIESLEATEAFRGVSDDMAGMAANARLNNEIRQFSLHYTDEDSPPIAVFEAVFRLLNLSDGKIIGTKIVNISVPASGTDKDSLARASESALGKGLIEASLWVVDQMGKLK